ncbi:MAG: acyl carrier protein [Anaerolineales bacterium]|nr:acyl carrier protein [Anaerolineales bacterium]
MNDDEILAQIKEAIFTIFDYSEAEKGEITQQTSLQGEAGLGADSLDLVELIQELEDRFGGTIEDDKVRDIKTIGDIVSYVKEHMM